MKRMIDYFNEEAKIHDDHFINQMGMAEFYDEIEKQLNLCKQHNNILVLGCGTGLEIERIKFESEVTAIDLSPQMLNELRKKEFYEGVHLKTICASILDYDFGREKYDLVLTCYTLHHFNVEQKQELFCRIHKCLKRSGVFLNGDSMSKNQEEEAYKMNEAEKAYLNEVTLLKQAGFQSIVLEREWNKTKLYRCIKE